MEYISGALDAITRCLYMCLFNPYLSILKHITYIHTLTHKCYECWQLFGSIIDHCIVTCWLYHRRRGYPLRSRMMVFVPLVYFWILRWLMSPILALKILRHSGQVVLGGSSGFGCCCLSFHFLLFSSILRTCWLQKLLFAACSCHSSPIAERLEVIRSHGMRVPVCLFNMYLLLHSKKHTIFHKSASWSQWQGNQNSWSWCTFICLHCCWVQSESTSHTNFMCESANRLFQSFRNSTVCLSTSAGKLVIVWTCSRTKAKKCPWKCKQKYLQNQAFTEHPRGIGFFFF